VVEHRLAKARVAGSSPVSRSRQLPYRQFLQGSQWSRVASTEWSESRICRTSFCPARHYNCSRWRGTQAVRERSAKPLCVGSIPTRASILPATFRVSRLTCHKHCRDFLEVRHRRISSSQATMSTFVWNHTPSMTRKSRSWSWSKSPQSRHSERSGSQMSRLKQRLWSGVEEPRLCLSYLCCSGLSTTEALASLRAGRIRNEK
jgi:hypothetical protein